MLCYYVTGKNKNKGGLRDESKNISSIYDYSKIKSGDRFDYTQWRQDGLPKTSLKELAEAANSLTNQLGNLHQEQ